MSARLFADDGIPSICTGGLTSAPWQDYLDGIMPSLTKAELVTFSSFAGAKAIAIAAMSSREERINVRIEIVFWSRHKIRTRMIN